MARSKKNDEEPTERSIELKGPNPVWFKPVMIGFMLIGLIWILVFYLTDQALPIPGIGPWNLAAGFGVAFIGFLMTTRWR